MSFIHKHLLFALSTSFLLMLPFQTFAEDKGWIKSANGWQYMEDGAPVTEEWRKSGNEDFYLGSDGVICTNMLLRDNENDLYFLNESGAKVKNAWRYIHDPYT